MKVYKNVAYYPDYVTARAVRDVLENASKARIINYERGYAIQKYKSGPYWSGKNWA